MSAVRFENKPELDRPVLVAAFSGWNDAGDAATSAVRHLASRWKAKSFATIESEDYFDFTVVRPTVRHTDGVKREIEWPLNRFTAAGRPDSPRDIIFLHGVEPQMRWQSFCKSVINVASATGVRSVLTLGGLLADVPHSRPARTTAVTNRAALLRRLDLTPSDYEGPTGIVSVLDDAFAQAGFTTLSLWTTVPHYVSQTPSPKATLALVEHTARALDVPVETTELENATTAYEEQVSELVASDDDVLAYVRQLETSEDENEEAQLSGAHIAAEVEQFLKDQES